MKENDIYLSVVIPAYNEEKRIKPTLDRIVEFLKNNRYKYELIIVDDGSNDGTVKIVNGFANKYAEIHLLKSANNMGKGHAVRKGMLAARGKRILFTDADLSVPFETVDKLLSWFDAGYDIVIGSRRLPDSDIQIHQPFYREFMGQVFRNLTRLLIVGKDISDITCGFKCFSSEAAKAVFSKQVTNDWSYDAELIYIAKRMKMRIKEIPVVWRDSNATKVHIFRDTIKTFWGLIRIKINGVTGKYNRNCR